MTEYSEIVKQLSHVAQVRINELHGREPSNGTFEQVGLLNGQELVLEFLNNAELALAMEHLLYMVHESGISFPIDDLQTLHSLASDLDIDNTYS